MSTALAASRNWRVTLEIGTALGAGPIAEGHVGFSGIVSWAKEMLGGADLTVSSVGYSNLNLTPCRVSDIPMRFFPSSDLCCAQVCMFAFKASIEIDIM
jgi:hypothetical protein